MPLSTITLSPAAGPLTLSADPLKEETTNPPTTPAMIPEKRGAPEARAMPRQSGNATKKTTTPAGRSSLMYLNVNPLGGVSDFMGAKVSTSQGSTKSKPLDANEQPKKMHIPIYFIYPVLLY
jgi:hypothetical protein